MKRSGLPKHVTWFYDRHGKLHVRARRHGTGYYFKAKPCTDDFLIEYQTWLAGGPSEIGSRITKVGTVSALVVVSGTALLRRQRRGTQRDATTSLL